jgi:hypothetical protein
MLTLFWILTLLFTLVSVTSILIWLKLTPLSLCILISLFVFSYSWYYFDGNSRLQPLIIEVKKQEYKLRFHLDDYPNDTSAESQLLELLGLQALQIGNKDLAKQYFEMSLKKLLLNPFHAPEKTKRTTHLNNLIKITQAD